MGRGCNRLSLKVKQRAGQRKKKERAKKRVEEVKAARSNRTPASRTKSAS